MRLFLAINPPPEVRSAIWMATAPMREAVPDVSWVAESKIHLTLKFLGANTADALPGLTETLMHLAATHSSAAVQLRGVGAFPNFRRPRVVWIGAEPDPKLELVHHDVELAGARLGYELDGRPFRPHLTVGRVREPLSGAAGRALRAAARKVRFTNEFLVRTIDLMQSVLSPTGSTYTTLVSAPMRSR